MRNFAKFYVAGLLTGILLFGSTVVFANTGVIRELFFGVNVVVDGVPQVFAYDMRPFVTDNRTFLPVRGIADILGVDVYWDGNTSTVYLQRGTQAETPPVVHVPPPVPDPAPPAPANVTWLDQLGHVNYRASGAANHFTAWPAGGRATDGTVFDRGVLLALNTSNWTRGGGGGVQIDGIWTTYQSMEFSLNAQYSSLRGTLVCAENNARGANAQGAQIRIYGDERLLYTSPPISDGTIPIDFDIDVSGVVTLKIHASIPNARTVHVATGDGQNTFVGIVNARFERN